MIATVVFGAWVGVTLAGSVVVVLAGCAVRERIGGRR